jgi:hypothetical protein
MRTIILFLILSAGSSSFGAHNLTLLSKIEMPSKSDLEKALTPLELKEDLNFLRFAIENAYSGFFFQRNNGIDKFLSEFASIQNRLSTPTGMEFCFELQKMLSLVKDHHFSLGTYKGSSCSGRLDSKGDGKVGINLGTRSESGSGVKKGWTINQVDGPSRKVDVLSIFGEFLPREDTSWDGFKDRIAELHRSGKDYILDLRGNSGGDSHMGENLVYILAGRQLDPPISFFNELVNVSALETRVNMAQLAGGDISQRQQALDAAKTNPTQPLSVNKGDPNAKAHYSLGELGSEAFQGKVVVLVDRQCASACEVTTLFLKTLPFVVVVGEATAGVLHFANSGLIQLPNSKILFGLPTTWIGFADGVYRESIGISPDIQTPTDAEALTSALKLISN